MTQLLIRLFVRHPDDTKNAAVRTAYGNLACIVSVVCNLLLAGGKIAVGVLTGSVAITADGMNNLSDASSNVVSLVGFKLGARPADSEHPYGHARYEYLAGLAVGFWETEDELRANWQEDRRWTPRWTAEQREAGYAGWRKAVERTLDWVLRHRRLQ